MRATKADQARWAQRRVENGIDSVPPDPEGENERRADDAEVAIRAFMDRTGTEREDALVDLLASLRHWCDRQSQQVGNADFGEADSSAHGHYLAEIGFGG